MNEQLLPDGFLLRPVDRKDAPAIARLIQTVDLVDMGETDFSEEDLTTFWKRQDFDPEQDAWVVVAPNGGAGGQPLIVGYEEVGSRYQHARLDGDGYVHPDYKERGIGTALLRRMEQRACEHIILASPEYKVSVRNGMVAADEAGRKLHENEGYTPVRYFYQMRIHLQEAPPEPAWPEGLRLRVFQPGDDPMPVFTAFEEAFRDHWGFTPWIFDNWKLHMLHPDHFDPGLWFLVMAGDEIAGGSLNKMRPEGGWVSQLAVRRPWRRMGLGISLLHQTFGEFYRRGVKTVSLGVDAASPTGATRLYQKAGMKVAHEFVIYEKVLRPGVDPSKGNEE